ncbi:MAG TPA: MBL fold metallo-hydrolase [Polyangiaceae bacterium]|nr:MBL fold metallo-hydrolase [Polyangiaceae bacterium]
MDKSSATKLDAPATAAPARAWSRRHWIGATAGAAIGALAAEAASLAGTWDHERPSPLAPRLRSPRAGALPLAGGGRWQGAPRLTHIGHSCHLIEIAGQRWLTDPWFFDPAFGSLRHSLALEVGAVGPLDGIFISHRHADHFDPTALRALSKEAAVWTPDPSLLGPLAELGFARVQLSQPWLTSASGPLQIGFAPALHDVPQHSLSLAGDAARVLFCADTGYHQHFGEIRRRFQPTTALLPCDGTRLRWEPRSIMNADEAARAAIELGCRQLLQTHGDAHYSDLVAEHVLSASDPAPLAGLRTALAALRDATRDVAAAEPAAPVPDFSPLAIGETRALFTP